MMHYFHFGVSVCFFRSGYGRNSQTKKILILFTFSVFLSIFTKGVQGLMLLPFAVVFLFVVSRRKLRYFNIISFSVLTSIAVALFYYLIRENFKP
jgi:4-amino-4-deoxy-L-arabinose transferase-like glycosyltransferase